MFERPVDAGDDVRHAAVAVAVQHARGDDVGARRQPRRVPRGEARDRRAVAETVPAGAAHGARADAGVREKASAVLTELGL